MITRTSDWKNALSEAVRDPAELLSMLGLPERLLDETRAADAAFPLRVPRGFVARMRTGDPDDPLLRQVLPLGAEMIAAPGFGPDPVGDGAAGAVPGVLHKYRGRVLLMATGACAVHCRYCFRRHYPYGEQAPKDRWAAALDYIGRDESVEEVLLSGGDPLMLDNDRLAELAARLAEIPHLRRLRLHTRLPIVLPERIDSGLLELLESNRLQPVVVVHANHPRELNEETARGFADMTAAGAVLFNQAVLLAGINDERAVLAELGERLFEQRVIPYYLHLLDRVAGAAHFEVPEPRARELHRKLMESMPGYLVPRLVREVAGAPYKIPC